jgi:hypothetical protein
MEKLFDETVERAMKKGWVSLHAGADGTLVRANASFKSFAPIEVDRSPEEYKAALRCEDTEDRGEREKEDPPPTEGEDQDKGNPSVDFCGEKRSNATHRSKTDPDCRFVSKGSSGTGAYPGYTVNAVMENRNRILVGVNVEVFKGPASETAGCVAVLDHAETEHGYKPKTVGADKGYFAQGFINSLFDRGIELILRCGLGEAGRASQGTDAGTRKGYRLSQRCRKKIEELFGKGKDYHGLRRVRRRFLHRYEKRSI